MICVRHWKSSVSLLQSLRMLGILIQIEVSHTAQNCLLQTSCALCDLPLLHIWRPLFESSCLNSPGQLLSTSAPSPVNHSIKSGLSKGTGDSYADLVERYLGSAFSFWAHLQVWDPQRGFLRDLNKGEMRSINIRGIPVCPLYSQRQIQWPGLLYPYIFTATFLLHQEHCLEHPIVPWWEHRGKLVCQHWH